MQLLSGTTATYGDADQHELYDTFTKNVEGMADEVLDYVNTSTLPDNNLVHVIDDIELHEVGWGSPDDTSPCTSIFDDILNNEHAITHDTTPVQDSASMVHKIPLYDQVKSALPFWRAIGANQRILEWIENGVSLPIQGTIPRFFQT